MYPAVINNVRQLLSDWLQVGSCARHYHTSTQLNVAPVWLSTVRKSGTYPQIHANLSILYHSAAWSYLSAYISLYRADDVTHTRTSILSHACTHTQTNHTQTYVYYAYTVTYTHKSTYTTHTQSDALTYACTQAPPYVHVH